MNGTPKAVADSVHRTIPLDSLETEIISTRAFQRLRNVKQLGLAHMGFPGADYSRFSHCLGVCHVTGRILDALNEKKPHAISPQERRRFRLAGLLHDVGHYPFSHATEYALKEHYTRPLVEPTEAPQALYGGQATKEPPYLDHEQVGVLTLRHDPQIAGLLAKEGIAPDDVSGIFTRSIPGMKLANLISSDLDADRIDYLLRTARHTGLPYGMIDLDYLLTQLCFDKEGFVCVHPKALRAVEHFLLARYFDYQQVSYHKTVAGLELVLRDVLRALLEEQRWKASPSEIRDQIIAGTWASVDDAYILERIRALARETRDDVVKEKARVILERSPPKLVARTERFAPRDRPTSESWTRERNEVEGHKKRWADRFGIPEALWYVWHQAELGLTKVGPQVPISEVPKGDAIKGKADQVVRMLVPSHSSSEAIFDVEQSMMSELAKQALYAIRVYVVLPKDKEARRADIENHIRQDLGTINWM